MTTRVDVHGAFTLDGPPGRVFALFTPRGERRWVDGWDPRFVHRPSGELELDQVS